MVKLTRKSGPKYFTLYLKKVSKNEMQKGELWCCGGARAGARAIESLGKEVYKIRKFINTCL